MGSDHGCLQELPCGRLQPRTGQNPGVKVKTAQTKKLPCLPEAQSSPSQDGVLYERTLGWALRAPRPPASRQASVSPMKWSIDSDSSGWGG